MRILIHSPAFLPQIGGLEVIAAQIAENLARRGNEVVVVTKTPGGESAAGSYLVMRCPGPAELLAKVRWCDVFFHVNVSLRGWWPLLLIRRPWVVLHESWYRRPDGRIAWQDRLKRILLAFSAISIAASRALADDLGVRSVVIPNSYRDHVFYRMPGIERSRDLVFVGRLVSDKGVDILLDALAILAAEGIRPTFSVVGDGPERAALEAQVRRLRLGGLVSFLGEKSGEEIRRILNQHRIMVVPSRYNEPFGIVALEGAACGCVVIGSEGGGLKEAIGPCGPCFPNGDAAALARMLGWLMQDEAACRGFRIAASDHLRKHTGAAMMARYGEVFASIQARKR